MSNKLERLALKEIKAKVVNKVNHVKVNDLKLLGKMSYSHAKRRMVIP